MIMYFLNDQTLCLNKLIVDRTFTTIGWIISGSTNFVDVIIVLQLATKMMATVGED